VRDHAAREFACSKAEVVVAAPYGRAFVASGCRHRAVFVIGMVGGLDSDGKYIIDMVPFDVTASTPSETNAPPSVVAWRSLMTRGAIDLACERDTITPDIVPQHRAPDVPIAEGCGHRATYVVDDHALRLIGLVPL
jgi:hypothetical protein